MKDIIVIWNSTMIVQYDPSQFKHWPGLNMNLDHSKFETLHSRRLPNWKMFAIQATDSFKYKSGLFQVWNTIAQHDEIHLEYYLIENAHNLINESINHLNLHYSNCLNTFQLLCQDNVFYSIQRIIRYVSLSLKTLDSNIFHLRIQ